MHELYRVSRRPYLIAARPPDLVCNFLRTDYGHKAHGSHVNSLELALLSASYRPAICNHIAAMFFHGARETMVAIVIADEVEEIALRRMHGGLQRSDSRIGDGAGRQPGILIGVVRRIELQVRLAVSYTH